MKFEYRYESLKSKFSVILFVYNLMIGCSKNNGEIFQVTRASTNHPSNNPGKARLRDGAEILVLFPHLCTRIWVHDWPDKKAIVDLPITLKGNSKHVTSNSLSPYRRCFSDVTNRGYIMSATQANLLVHKCEKTSSPDSRCSFFFSACRKAHQQGQLLRRLW